MENYINLKCEKIYFKKGVTTTGKKYQFYVVVCFDETGGKYVVNVSPLDLDFAKTRAEYFNDNTR